MKQHKLKDISSDLPSNIRDLFAGKYDRHYLFSKTQHDLDRMLQASTPFKFHHSLIDFSINIKHLAEWHWYEVIKMQNSWKGKKLADYQEWLKSVSGEFLIFDEIANTVKHHTRKYKNVVVQKIQLHRDQDGVITDPSILENCLTWKIGPLTQKVLPVLTTQANEQYQLIYAARKVIQFWQEQIFNSKDKSN